MDCATFANELERALTGALDGRDRERALTELTRHAESCRDCAGVEALLAWLGLPDAERDIVDGPGPAYWEGFNDRLRRRIVEGRVEKYKDEVVLLRQEYIRDGSKTIQDLLNESVASIGENIVIRRFVRYELGEHSQEDEDQDEA